MKFLAILVIACTLTSTVLAHKPKTCGNVTIEVYKDSDCSTLDKETTEHLKDANFAITCFENTNNDWVSYKCNTDALYAEDYTKAECAGHPKKTVMVVWG